MLLHQKHNINDLARFQFISLLTLMVVLCFPSVSVIAEKGIDVLDIASNSLDNLKTERFAKMFMEKGVKLPVQQASANITTRKGYDNGYLLIDDNNDIFHLKMQVNRPSMAKIEKPDSVIPTHVFIQEQPDKAFYGFVSTASGKLYAISRDNYEMIPLQGFKFNPETDKISILKGLFSWVIKLGKSDGYEWVALDSKTLDFIDRYEYKRPKSFRRKLSEFASLLKI